MGAPKPDSAASALQVPANTAAQVKAPPPTKEPPKAVDSARAVPPVAVELPALEPPVKAGVTDGSSSDEDSYSESYTSGSSPSAAKERMNAEARVAAAAAASAAPTRRQPMGEVLTRTLVSE